MCTVVKKESCFFIADEKIFKGKLTPIATLANEIAFGVCYLEGYINRFKIPGHTKDFKNGTYCNSVQCQTTRVKVGGNGLAQKKAQLIPCTVVLYEKGVTNQ